MNVLLMDIDSKIPNLALMKISAYHKSINNKVSLITLGENKPDLNNVLRDITPDKTYISIIFKKNKPLVDNIVGGLRFMYPDSLIDIGGSGYSLTKTLPREIEYIMPDYDIYSNCDSSYGYTSRGCNRNCYFCIVTKKEGKFKRNMHPSRFYNPKYKKITFLDSGILWDKEWFKTVANWCIQKEISPWFTQGFDIRLIDENDVDLLIKLHGLKGNTHFIEFAWDDIRLEKVIRNKIEMLKNQGLKIRQYAQFYVYVDNDEEFDSGLYRCNTLKELGTNPFVMFNIDNERTKRIVNLQSWANFKGYFWKSNFEDFCKTRNKTDYTIDEKQYMTIMDF